MTIANENTIPPTADGNEWLLHGKSVHKAPISLYAHLHWPKIPEIFWFLLAAVMVFSLGIGAEIAYYRHDNARAQDQRASPVASSQESNPLREGPSAATGPSQYPYQFEEFMRARKEVVRPGTGSRPVENLRYNVAPPVKAGGHHRRPRYHYYYHWEHSFDYTNADQLNHQYMPIGAIPHGK